MKSVLKKAHSHVISTVENQIFFHALTGDYQSLHWALHNGVSVNIIDPVTTDSPLMIACRKGYSDIVKLCLEYGAKNDPHPEFGHTALHAAIIAQSYDCARTILETAAPSDADHMISNLADPTGQTPLHIAAYLGSALLVELLLSHGGRIASIDMEGQTPLHLCASSGDRGCLAMMLDHGGDDIIDMQDNAGNTPLHHASFHGRLECVRLLLETAANVLVSNTNGLTPYNIASSQGHHQVGLLLLEYRKHHLSNNVSQYDLRKAAGAAAASHLSSSSFKSNAQRSTSNDAPDARHTFRVSSVYGSNRLPHQPPLSHTDDFNDDHESDERDKVITLDVLPPAPPPVESYRKPASSRVLSLEAPINALSSMYGRNGGVGYIDSIGNFLPRPHTVNSPATSSSKSFASHLTAKTNHSPAVNTRSMPDGYSPPLTSPTSDYLHSLESGADNGYKVLPKPSLSRHFSDSRLIGQSSKVELFEGVLTYNKDSISTIRNGLLVSTRNSDSTGTIVTATDVIVPDSPKGSSMRGVTASTNHLPHAPTGLLSGASEEDTQQGSIGPNVEHRIVVDEHFYDDVDHTYYDDEHTYEHDTASAYEHEHEQYPQEEYADPSEQFTYLGIEWRAYYTSEGHLYYLDLENNHSQWEDPREHGIVHTVYDQTTEGDPDHHHHHQQSLYTSFEPPKSPSPKAFDKGKFFGLNYRDEAADRLSGLKPLQITYEEEETGGGGLQLQLRDTCMSLHFQPIRADELSSEVDDDDDDDDAHDGPNSHDNDFTNGGSSSSIVSTPGNNLTSVSNSTPNRDVDGIIRIVVSCNASDDDDDDDVCSEANYRKYVDMIKTGHRVQDVVETIERDGFNQDFKLQVLMRADREFIDLPPLDQSQVADMAIRGAESLEDSSVTVRQETLEGLKSDATLAKYAKMLSMGVHPGGVIAKMKMDMVEVHDRNRLMRSVGYMTEEAVDARVEPSIRKPTSQMQCIHWNPLPAEKLKNSIWWTADQQQHQQQEVDGVVVACSAGLDMDELERLFGGSHTLVGNTDDKANSERRPHAQKVSLTLKHLERRRAQNISIGLVPFRRCGTHMELLKAICSLNSMDGLLTADNLETFKTLLPTDSELKRIDAIDGSQHPSELFLQAAMMFYPELPHRLLCFISCLNFPTACDVTLDRSKRIINTCNQILSSSNLARLLKRMLLIGNAMNQGSRKEEVSGFTLDSLLKIISMKGVDKKTSVLDYLVRSLYDKQEVGMLQVVDELSLVDENTKLAGSDVLNEYSGLEQALLQLERDYSMNSSRCNELHMQSPTAKSIIDEFNSRLLDHLTAFRHRMSECEKVQALLRKKLDEIASYFGEDTSTCDTRKLFGVLSEFKRALLLSKANTEWRISRNSHS